MFTFFETHRVEEIYRVEEILAEAARRVSADENGDYPLTHRECSLEFNRNKISWVAETIEARSSEVR